MTNSSTATKNTTAFAAQAAISFGASLFAMLVAIYFMETDPWIKGFLALGTLYLTTSTFTLAKVVRDMQDDNTVVHRLDAARPRHAGRAGPGGGRGLLRLGGRRG